jgi:hypothetical protein
MIRIALLLAVVALTSACNTPGERPRQWTCAAYCPGDISCSSNGTSTVNTTLVTSSGTTAAEAFTKLDDTCGRRVVATVSCRDGHIEDELASVGSSCGQN